MSALSLQRVRGLGSYETAWALLCKLRPRDGAARLRPARGRSRADETCVGDVATGKRGRGAGMGRCRLVRVPDIGGESLLAAIEESVEPGAVVYTDHYGGYNGVGAAGYVHYPTAISRSGDPAYDELIDKHGLERLDQTHGGSPAAAGELPAHTPRGVETESVVGKHTAGKTVAEVAAVPQETFVAAATKGAKEAQREAETERARQVWSAASRVAKLSSAWTSRCPLHDLDPAAVDHPVGASR